MTFSLVSYGAAAVGYGLLAMLLGLSRQSAGQGRWLLAAIAGTALWGAFITAALVVTSSTRVPSLASAADALRVLLWTLCLLAALPGSSWQSTKRLLTGSAVLLAALAVALPPLLGDASGTLIVLGSTVVGCLALEQIFRNSSADQQRVLRPFLWTIAAIFGYDLF